MGCRMALKKENEEAKLEEASPASGTVLRHSRAVWLEDLLADIVVVLSFEVAGRVVTA